MSRRDGWHGFDDIEDDYAMLDPIKLTITTPGIDDEGRAQELGIPAAIVTNYLIDHGIVCEKTDYYSFLLLNSLGTTRAKQGTLLAELLKFKEMFDENRPLCEVFPELVSSYPERYGSCGLRDHAQEMHRYLVRRRMLGKMQAAFEVIPRQELKPADAYREVVRRNVEYLHLDQMRGRIPAVMIVPYPPGIPVAMGGELLDGDSDAILDYLLARQDFENAFPGYEGDIHGVERDVVNGKTFFKTLCIKSR